MMEEWEQKKINEASEYWIITKFFGNVKIIKCLKDIYGIFRPYATGGIHNFNISEILVQAHTLEELENKAPEYFI